MEHLFFVTVLDNLQRFPLLKAIGTKILPRLTTSVRDKHSGFSREKIARYSMYPILPHEPCWAILFLGAWRIDFPARTSWTTLLTKWIPETWKRKSSRLMLQRSCGESSNRSGQGGGWLTDLQYCRRWNSSDVSLWGYLLSTTKPRNLSKGQGRNSLTICFSEPDWCNFCPAVALLTCIYLRVNANLPTSVPGISSSFQWDNNQWRLHSTRCKLFNHSFSSFSLENLSAWSNVWASQTVS